MGEPTEDRKAEDRRQKQELVAAFCEENGIPVRTFPASMIPPRYVDLTPVVAKPKRQKPPVRTEQPADRWEEFKTMIAGAARKANTNLMFCKLLDQAKVPIPKGWPVKSWVAAYNDRSLHASIRRFKSRHKSAS